MIDMYRLSEKIIKSASAKADFALLNTNISKESSVEISNGNINSSESVEKCAFILKVWVDGKEGVFASDSYDPSIVSNAVKIAKLNNKEKYFYGLPMSSKFPSIKLFDSEIVKLQIDDLVLKGKSIIKEATSDITSLAHGGIMTQMDENLTLNSNGVEYKEKSTQLGAYCEIIAKKEGKISTYWDSKDESKLWNMENMVRKTKDKSIDFLQPQKLSPSLKSISLSPATFSALLSYAFLSNLNGKNVENGKSIFQKDTNGISLSDELTIIDDAKMDYGIHSTGCDFEGTSSQETILIKNGKVKNYLYDFNTAKNNEKLSTGNATIKGIEPSNIIIKGKNNHIGKSIIVDSIIGTHTADPISTHFSVKVEKGYLQDGGKLIPLKEFMISGKMIDVLKDILSIGKDVEQQNGIYSGSLTTSKINVSF